jgi:hypothetical protein
VTRPVYGPILSVVRAAAHAESRLVARARAAQPSAERGAELVGAQPVTRIVDRSEAESRARVEARWGSQ